MGWFSSRREETQPVYEQPIVHRPAPTYDHQAKPTAKQEDMMLDFALGHDKQGMVEELAEQGWLFGRKGWVKQA